MVVVRITNPYNQLRRIINPPQRHTEHPARRVNMSASSRTMSMQLSIASLDGSIGKVNDSDIMALCPKLSIQSFNAKRSLWRFLQVELIKILSLVIFHIFIAKMQCFTIQIFLMTVTKELDHYYIKSFYEYN